MSSLPQPSRDPRRNRGPSSAPHPPLPARTQDNTLKSPNVQGISHLIIAGLKKAAAQAERDKVRKNVDTATELLQKAQASKRFPNIVAHYEQTRNRETASLSRAEEDLRESNLRYAQLERTLQNDWFDFMSSVSSPSDDKRLQEVVNTARADAAQAKADVLQLSKANKTLEQKLEEMQKRLDDMARSSAENNARMNTLVATGEKHQTALDKLESGNMSPQLADTVCQNVTIRMAPQLNGFKDLNTAKIEEACKDFESKIQAARNELNSRVDATRAELVPAIETARKSVDALSTTVSEIGGTVQDHALKLTQSNIDKTIKLYKQYSSFGRRLDTFEARLNDIQNGNSATNGTTHSRSAPETSHPELAKFIEIQQFKDDVLASQVEEIERFMKGLQKQLDAVKETDDRQSNQLETLQADYTRFAGQISSINAQYTRLSSELKKLQPMAASSAVQQLEEKVAGISQVLDTIRVAVHSLETRYNNLSTEPVVKSMVIAMQEMYPSAGKLIEQTTKLREWVEKELPALNQRIDNLLETESSHFNESQQDAAQRLDDINRLRNDHASLSQSLTPLWARYTSEAKLASEDDLNNLRTELASLRDKLGGVGSEIDKMKNQTSPFRVGDGLALSKRYDELVKKVQNMMTGLENLTSAMDGVKSTNESNSQTVEDLTGQVRKLADQLSEITSINTNNTQSVNTLETELKKLESGLADIKSTNENISDILRARETELKTLKTDVREAEKNVEGRVQAKVKEDVQLWENGIFEKLEKKFHGAVSSARQSNEGLSVPLKQESGSSPDDENAPLVPRKKKKRPRPTVLSDDERPSETPMSMSVNSSQQPSARETPTGSHRRKKRKKKSLGTAENPVDLGEENEEVRNSGNSRRSNQLGV
ncbi:hypothetical protein BDV59DRAFT_204236 [Aspergillus ambiguus]|uniref:uncharacterized protein n=1 Tax=Aspergillus ambiguus TaxID=176160 RepID=UPI003CCD2C9C